MIPVSSQLETVLEAGGYQSQFVVDVIVDGTRVLKQQPLVPGSFTKTQDGTARVRTTATCQLVYSDSLGSSIAPETLTDWLTPFATYLNVYQVISVGQFTETVLVGHLKLVDNSELTQAKVLVKGEIFTIGSTINLSLADAFQVTDAEDFPATSAPTHANAWDEMAFITGLPILRNVSDVAIPGSMTYSTNRLDGVLTLGNVLGGVPYINNLGQVTLQTNAWGDEVDGLEIGARGTIIDVTPADQNDAGIYNQIVGSGTAADQSPIYVTWQLNSGPLRYGGPFGRRPYQATLPPSVVDTPSAQAYVNALGPVMSTAPAAQLVVTAVPDPRYEVGDVVPFQRRGPGVDQDGNAGVEQLVGRITNVQFGDAGAMQLTMGMNRV